MVNKEKLTRYRNADLRTHPFSGLWGGECLKTAKLKQPQFCPRKCSAERTATNFMGLNPQQPKSSTPHQGVKAGRPVPQVQEASAPTRALSARALPDQARAGPLVRPAELPSPPNLCRVRPWLEPNSSPRWTTLVVRMCSIPRRRPSATRLTGVPLSERTRAGPTTQAQQELPAGLRRSPSARPLLASTAQAQPTAPSPRNTSPSPRQLRGEDARGRVSSEGERRLVLPGLPWVLQRPLHVEAHHHQPSPPPTRIYSKYHRVYLLQPYLKQSKFPILHNQLCKSVVCPCTQVIP